MSSNWVVCPHLPIQSECRMDKGKGKDKDKDKDKDIPRSSAPHSHSEL